MKAMPGGPPDVTRVRAERMSGWTRRQATGVVNGQRIQIRPEVHRAIRWSDRQNQGR